MKIMILGMGKVGSAVADRLRQDGHQVIGTTTRESRVAEVKKHCDEVAVLVGSDSDKIRAVGKGCDAILVTVAPDVAKAKNKEEREASYRAALVDSCESAATANKRVIFLSSFSVYGDGGKDLLPITERTPLGNVEEPSAKYYQMAEDAVLTQEKGCVLRLPDIYGAPNDLSFADRVRLGHKLMGGRVPFGPDAPLYGIHYLDVVAAAIHSINKALVGIFNVCDNGEVPMTNKAIFDKICEREDLPNLTFLDEIKAPNRRISSDKLMETGFALKHTEVNYPLKEALEPA